MLEKYDKSIVSEKVRKGVDGCKSVVPEKARKGVDGYKSVAPEKAKNELVFLNSV